MPRLNCAAQVIIKSTIEVALMPETERLELCELYRANSTFFDFIRPERDWNKDSDKDREPPGPECYSCWHWGALFFCFRIMRRFVQFRVRPLFVHALILDSASSVGLFGLECALGLGHAHIFCTPQRCVSHCLCLTQPDCHRCDCPRNPRATLSQHTLRGCCG